MSRSLPPNPSLRQLKIQARELLEAFGAGDPHAVARVRHLLPRLAGASPEVLRAAHFSLRDAQLVIAREYGFPSWPRLSATLRGPRAEHCLACGSTPPGAQLLHLPADGRLCAACLSAASQVLGGHPGSGWAQGTDDSVCTVCRRPGSWGVRLAVSEAGPACVCDGCAGILRLQASGRMANDEEMRAYGRALGTELVERHGQGDPHAARRVAEALPGWRTLVPDEVDQAPLEARDAYLVIFREWAPAHLQAGLRNPFSRNYVHALQELEQGWAAPFGQRSRHYLQRQVERLLEDHASGKPPAARRMKVALPERAAAGLAAILASPVSRDEAQAVVAAEFGATGWRELLTNVELGHEDLQRICGWLQTEAEAIRRELGRAEPHVAHLLLALLHSSRPEVTHVLDSLRLEKAALERLLRAEASAKPAGGQATDSRPGSAPPAATLDDLSVAFADLLQGPSEAAAAIALDMDSPAVHAGHLFLALLTEPGLAAPGLLAERGIDLARVRAAVAACPTISRESWSPESQSPSFSGEFRRALGYARDESARLSHDHVGTEHLLLGITRESANRGAALLALELGVGLGGLRSALETYRRPSASDATADGMASDVRWTPRASEAVWSAVAEARSLAAPETGPEHLLLALLRDTRSTAAQVLACWSVTYAAALAKVRLATEDDAR